MEKTMFKRALKAGKIFLENRGYEVVSAWENGEGEQIGWVSRDKDEPEDGLVFGLIQVRSREEGFDNEVNRVALESAALVWLKSQDRAPAKLRFDDISMIVLNEHRAFLRHHVDMLTPSDDLQPERKDEKPNLVVLKTWEEKDRRVTALVFRPNAVQPFVVAYGFNAEQGDWAYGSYHETALTAWAEADPEIVENLSQPVSVEDLQFAFKDEGKEYARDEVKKLAEHCEREIDVKPAIAWVDEEAGPCW